MWVHALDGKKLTAKARERRKGKGRNAVYINHSSIHWQGGESLRSFLFPACSFSSEFSLNTTFRNGIKSVGNNKGEAAKGTNISTVPRLTF